MRISIFKKIFISQLLLIVFVSGLISLTGYFFMVRLHNEAQNDTLRIVSSSAAARVAAEIALHKATLKEIAEAGEAALYAKRYQEPLLAGDLIRHQEQFPALSFVDMEGNQELRLVNGHAAGEALDNLAGLEVVKSALAAPDQAVLGEIVLDPILQTPTLLFGYSRVDHSGGRFLGLIIGQAPLARIVAPAGCGTSLKNGYCRIVAPDGTILSDPEPKNLLKPLVVKDQSLGRFFAKAAAEPDGQIHRAMLNGEDCYFALTLIKGTPWLAMSVLPSSQYTAAPRQFLNFAGLVFLALLLLAGISAFFVARGIASPIRKLARAGASLAKGNPAQQIGAGNDEVNDLAEAFKAMAEKLEAAMSREKQLLAAEASAWLRAEIADQHKAEFLAKISHELQTPLNIILGMTELLENGEDSGKRQPEVGSIREAGLNLLQLINGILDFSRLENGAISLAPAPFDPYAILGRLKEKYEPAANAKGLRLSYPEPAAVPTTVVGDEGRIFRILENLLDNAVKFTEHGEISLRVRVLDLKAVNGQHIIHLRFEVADTGRGIPLEEQPAMFESFRQLDPQAAGKTGGLGIGLSLSQQLVELMHGKIGIKSEPGKGSTFYVELDLPVAKDEPEVANVAAVQPGMKPAMNILVAEDNSV